MRLYSIPKRRQRLGRELLCWFGGHKYKFPATEKTEYFDKTDKIYLYYPTWRPITWWQFKCRRCRKSWSQMHFMAPQPWWKRLWWWIGSTIRHIGIVWEVYGEEHKKSVVSSGILLLLTLLQPFKEFSVQILWDTEIPSELWVWTLDLEHWFFVKLDEINKQMSEIEM